MKYSIMCATAVKPNILRLIVDVSTTDGDFEESAEIAVDISNMMDDEGTLNLAQLEMEVEKQVKRLSKTIDAATQVNEYQWNTNTVEAVTTEPTVINKQNLAYGANR